METPEGIWCHLQPSGVIWHMSGVLLRDSGVNLWGIGDDWILELNLSGVGDDWWDPGDSGAEFERYGGRLEGLHGFPC